MKATYNVDFLKKHPAFWSRLGFFCDPTVLGDNDEILCHDSEQSKFADYHGKFAEAGVKVHTSILHSGWVGIDKYDYRLTDQILEELFKKSPEILYIPRVKLNVPVEWCKENPTETFVYYEGVPYRDKIPELVGTLRHDWLGYVSDTGVYRGSKDPRLARSNRDSLIALQSFSSERWLNDAWVALEKFIDHIEEKYGDRIIGYHVAYGAQGESVPWGRASNHYGDYGITQLKKFYEFALEKYGTHATIENAWGFKVDPEGVFLPSPDERYGKLSAIGEFFRENNSVAVDYDEFSSKINAEALIYFCKKIKEKNGKLTGGFYGYMDYVENANYAGHLAIKEILDSPYIDFLAAPKSYYRCECGASGGFMCPIDSVSRRKLWLDELDNRLHLCVDAEAFENVTKTLEETQCVLFRELSRNLSHDASFWWMDLGGGWYNSPEIMATVKKMVTIKELLDKKAHESVADVLLFTDEAGLFSTMPSEKFICRFNRNIRNELAKSGVIYDHYRFDDIGTIDTSRYQLVIFAYCFAVSDREKAFIDQMIAEGKTVMFQHAAGIHFNGQYDIANIERFTGFKVEADEISKEREYPTLHIVEGNKKCLFAKHEKRIMSVEPQINSEILRMLAEEAGCHLYADGASVVYGDNRFISIFSGEGLVTVKFPVRGNYVDLISGEHFEETDEIKYLAKKESAKIIIRNDTDL